VTLKKELKKHQKKLKKVKNSFLCLLSILIIACNNENNSNYAKNYKTLYSFAEPKVLLEEGKELTQEINFYFIENLNNKDSKISNLSIFFPYSDSIVSNKKDYLIKYTYTMGQKVVTKIIDGNIYRKKISKYFWEFNIHTRYFVYKGILSSKDYKTRELLLTVSPSWSEQK
jgi:hypothetical protein